MTLTIPPGVDAEGRMKVIWTPTQSLSVANLSGPTAVELSCYLTKGSIGESADTDRGTDERVCSRDVGEVLGKTKWSITDLEYVWDPQADAADPNNKAYETLKPRTPGWLTIQWGLDVEDDLVTGSKVDQFPITVGEQVRKQPEGNAAEKLKIVQPVVVAPGVLRDQVLVA